MIIRACTTMAASGLSTSTPILGVRGLTRYKKMIHWLKSNASRWRCIYAPIIIYCTARARHASPLSGERMCLPCRKNHFFNMWRDMVVYGPISPSAQGPPYQPKNLPFGPYRVWLGMTPVWGYISTYKGMPWNTSVDRHFNQCFEKHYPMPLHCFLRCYQYSD